MIEIILTVVLLSTYIFLMKNYSLVLFYDFCTKFIKIEIEIIENSLHRLRV